MNLKSTPRWQIHERTQADRKIARRSRVVVSSPRPLDFATFTYPISLTGTLKLSSFPFRAPQWGFSVCGKETTCLPAKQNNPAQLNHRHHNQHCLQCMIPNICVQCIVHLVNRLFRGFHRRGGSWSDCPKVYS